jgi:hypothetical protein
MREPGGPMSLDALMNQLARMPEAAVRAFVHAWLTPRDAEVFDRASVGIGPSVLVLLSARALCRLPEPARTHAREALATADADNASALCGASSKHFAAGRA